MACCLTAPSLYLKQCWLIISEAFWHSPEGSFTGNGPDIYLWYEFDNYLLKTTAKFPRGQWVKTWLLSTLDQVTLVSKPTAPFQLVRGMVSTAPTVLHNDNNKWFYVHCTSCLLSAIGPPTTNIKMLLWLWYKNKPCYILYSFTKCSPCITQSNYLKYLQLTCQSSPWGWDMGCLLWVKSVTQIVKFMGPTWGPPGSCRPQMGPILATWTLLSGMYVLPE